VTRGGIVPVPLKPDAMEGALLGGKVDAVCTWNYPLAQIRRRLGANATMILDREIYTETYNLAAQQAFARQRPETVRRCLRALVKAEGFVAKHPKEAQALMASASGMDPEVVREVWDTFRYKLQLDETLPLTLEDETRWAMKNKLTNQTVMPNYLDSISSEGLLAVKPESVRLRR
jgi:NitT/TauT family transport system substrate-binding protein